MNVYVAQLFSLQDDGWWRSAARDRFSSFGRLLSSKMAIFRTRKWNRDIADMICQSTNVLYIRPTRELCVEYVEVKVLRILLDTRSVPPYLSSKFGPRQRILGFAGLSLRPSLTSFYLLEGKVVSMMSFHVCIVCRS